MLELSQSNKKEGCAQLITHNPPATTPAAKNTLILLELRPKRLSRPGGATWGMRYAHHPGEFPATNAILGRWETQQMENAATVLPGALTKGRDPRRAKTNPSKFTAESQVLPRDEQPCAK